MGSELVGLVSALLLLCICSLFGLRLLCVCFAANCICFALPLHWFTLALGCFRFVLLWCFVAHACSWFAVALRLRLQLLCLCMRFALFWLRYSIGSRIPPSWAMKTVTGQGEVKEGSGTGRQGFRRVKEGLRRSQREGRGGT